MIKIDNVEGEKIMLPITSIMSIGCCLGGYCLCFLLWPPKLTQYLKLFFYTIVFVALFFPEINQVVLGPDMKWNIHLYAIVLCGIELIEKYTQLIIRRRIEKGKSVSKHFLELYELL